MNTTTFTALAHLLEGEKILVAETLPQGTADVTISGSSCDSRTVSPHNLFVCKGVAFRPAFLTSALQAGASAYLCDEAHADELASVAPHVPALVTSDVRRAMALCSAAAWDRPDQALPLVGITGTKGKTTCAYMLRSIMDCANGPKTCGIMGTVETFDGVEDQPSQNTTPEAPDLWRHLSHARDAQLKALIMEVSSQALKYDRTLGVHLAIGCFLNIGLDHISPVEHKDFEDYFSSKLKIFSQCETAVVNLDSDHADRILETARAHATRTLTFALSNPKANAWADELAHSEEGVSFSLHLDGWTRRVQLPFPGDFSVSNALCAALCAHLLGAGPEAIVDGLAHTRVPGRMEFHRTSDRLITAIVDYAHNRLSFESLLSTVSSTFAGARVIAVFGAVGGKATERRRVLPEVAAQYADHIILTSDDPWTEDPLDICHEMEAALPQGFSHEIVVDREEAVARAFAQAEDAAAHGEKTVILLLAKGFENYQHVGNEFVPCPTDSELAERGVAAHDALDSNKL